MKKTYRIPANKVILLETGHVCEGSIQMKISNGTATHHSDDPDQDVLVKGHSSWDDEW